MSELSVVDGAGFGAARSRACDILLAFDERTALAGDLEQCGFHRMRLSFGSLAPVLLLHTLLSVNLPSGAVFKFEAIRSRRPQKGGRDSERHPFTPVCKVTL